jgi:hypothetical protein
MKYIKKNIKLKCGKKKGGVPEKAGRGYWATNFDFPLPTSKIFP